MTDHTDAPDIMERMKARMERHEVGWLTWREADARAFFAEIERLRRELLDTLRNDERHVIERDEARAELGEARKHIEALLTTHLRGCVCPLFHDPARAFLDRYANPTSSKPNDAQSGEQ